MPGLACPRSRRDDLHARSLSEMPRHDADWLPAGHHGSLVVAEWHPGPPSDSVWQGVEVSKDAVPALEAHRCQSCGFVEFYANEPVSAR